MYKRGNLFPFYAMPTQRNSTRDRDGEQKHDYLLTDDTESLTDEEDGKALVIQSDPAYSEWTAWQSRS